jgi:membrane glycosyltransferase
LKNFLKKIIYEKIILAPKFYVGLMVLLTIFFVYLAASSSLNEADRLYAILWLTCFGFLTFNIGYVFFASIYGLFVKPIILKEKDVQNIPKTAIIYTIKNESTGLFERIDYSLSHNYFKENVDLCILSDSDDIGYPYEEEVVRRLREKYGFDKIKYIPRKVHIEKKYGALRQWAFNYMDYEYIYVNDADSVMGKGNLLKLIRKAEHPENQNIANFQSRLNGIHAKTYFARAMADNAEIGQKMYVTTNNSLFGRSMSFGHGCLIRTKCFMQTEVPPGALSHDIWETATLDIKGWRTVFCYDVVAFEEHPSNYLESVKRDRRWMRGNFQGFSLIFHPKLSFGTRFYISYGLYVYLAEITFLFWIILNFWKAYTSAYFIPLTYDPALAFMLVFVMSIIWGHKYLSARSSEDAKKITMGTIVTTLVCLNGVYHKGLAILLLPFTQGGWNPMAKNPYEKISWKELIVAFWPVTLLGILLSYFGIRYAPMWALVSAPFLINFTFSVPLTYLTSLTTD